MPPTEQRERDRELIERHAMDHHGLNVNEWRPGEDGIRGYLGRWRVIEDDEERGLFGGDEGEMYACVVGAARYGNERVSYAFVPDSYEESGGEVTPFEDLDPL